MNLPCRHVPAIGLSHPSIDHFLFLPNPLGDLASKHHRQRLVHKCKYVFNRAHAHIIEQNYSMI